jgi:hypothetical protein
MDEDIIAILATFLIFFVPVVGITARIALKPFNEAILQFVKNRGAGQDTRILEQRLALLEQEFQAMRADVVSIADQREFYKRLAEGKATPDVLEP